MLSVAAAVGTPWSGTPSQHVAPHSELPAFFSVDMHGHLAASLLLFRVVFYLTYLSQTQHQGKGDPGNLVCTNPVKTAAKVRQDALCAEESR